MNTATIRKIIQRREATNDEWQDEIERCWTELSSALTEDYEMAKTFLLNDCTPSEASWVSEVYEEIIQKTQSRDYIELLRKNIERFPEENKKYHMEEQLSLAIDSCYKF